MKNYYISSLHFISKHLVTLLVLALFLFGVGSVSGATYTSTATGGPWSTASTWVGNAVPVNSNNNSVVIIAGATVTLSSATTWGQALTVNNGGTLNLNGNTLSAPTSVTLNGTGVGNNGALINNSGTAVTFASNITGTYSVGGSGAITLTGNVQGTLTKVGINTLTLGGTPDNIGLGVIANSGTVILAKTSSGGVHAIGGGGLTIGGATVKLSGTGGDQIYDGCTVTINSGTFDLNAQSESIDGLTGSGGTILNNVLGASTLTFGIGNSSNIYPGIISNGSGGLSLVKAGTGTETFNGLNTYSGNTTVNGGILKAGVANQSFGIASAVTLANTTGVGLDITGFNTTIGSLTGGGATGGNVTLGSNTLTIGSNNTSPAAYVGIISGTGGITKNGTGALTLSGANTYTGTTTISAGILIAGANVSVSTNGPFGNAASALMLGDANTTTNNSSPSLLTGGAFTIARPVTVASQSTSGTYSIGGNTANTSVFSGAINMSQPLTVSQVASGTLTVGTSGITNGANLLTGAGAGNITISSVIGNGSGGLTMNGTGTLTLSSANTYSGGTIVNAGTLNLSYNNGGTGTIGGTLIVNSGATAVATVANALGYAGTGWVKTLNINGGTFTTSVSGDQGWGIIINLNGGTLSATGGGYYSLGGGSSINSLASSTSSTISAPINIRDGNPSNILPITVADGAADQDLIISGIIQEANITGGCITKAGAGTLTLSGANSYSGATTISAGILKLNNTAALGTTSSTSVTLGGTLDLNGITLSPAILLTLNGTGVSSGGALINSSGTPTNYNGAITLGSASSIGTTGNITLGANITGGQDLTKVGGGILSLGSGTVTLGKLTISAGTLTSTSGTMTLTGDFTNNATFTHNSGTVTMSGAVQSITGATTFYNLTLAGSGTKTFAGTTNISNTFTINNNVVANLGNTLVHTANAYYIGATQQNKGSWGSSGSSANYINNINFDPTASGILNVTTGPCGSGWWTGAVSSDWNVTGNWCNNTIPTATTNVTIPAGGNQPVIGTAGGLCNNISINSGATLTLNVVTNLFVNGNWINNGTFSASGIGSIIFSGTASQVIGGSTSTSFYNLTIQNSGAVGSNLVTLNKPTTVTGTLLLVDGNLVTNATNLMTISKLSPSAIMGGSSSSFIDGPVIWSLPAGLTTGTTYNFPVGDNTAYLPFTLVNPSTSAGTTALVEAFNTNSGGTGNGISNTEYWKLTTAAGFTNSSVSLGKGSTTVYPYDLILGNTVQTGAYTSLGGTTGFYDITNSNAIGANSYFALGASATPKINFVPVILGGFFYIYNFGPSNEQTFILNGTSLTDGITVSAPTHFEISLTSGTGFAPSIVLPIVSGNKVNTTPIYIRLKAGLAIGTYSSEKVTMASTGATTKEITCEGTVFATTPTIITSGGRNCPPNNNQIQLGSSGDNINILYWTGPNNYYSQSPTPLISPADATYDGTYTVTGSLPTGGNLINNGDFELQNVGFSSSYAFVDSTSVPTAACYNFILGCEGTYTVVMSPFSVHGNFLKVPDHSNPGKWQMVINGAVTANVSVWSQTVKVIPNSTYQFSYWLQSVNLQNPSKLQLFANNQPVGTIFTANSQAGWNQYFYNWNSGSNTDVVLDLRNQNIVPDGNDFALDDIVFRTVTQVSSSIKVTSTDVVAVSITTPTNTVTTGTNVTFSATPTNGGTSPDYVWTVTNGASTTSYPTTKSNSFSYVPTDGDVISCVMTSNSTCITKNPATSNAITMIVTGNKNLWIGALGIGGTVWGDKANWTVGKVPASSDNVEFATTDNYTTAAKNDLYVDYNRIVGNLINASAMNLVIPANTQLYVNNKIKLTRADINTKYDQIQIKADNTGVQPNGSLIFYNLRTEPVYATIELYSKAYKEGTPIVVNGVPYSYNWQLFGIPLTSVAANPTFYDSYVRQYQENKSGLYTKWNQLDNSSVLYPFKGYEITQLAPKTLTFQGTLVNNDTTISLPVTAKNTVPTVYFRGQHILSNPYAAAIDARDIVYGANTESTAYLYNTGSFGKWYNNGGGTTYDEYSTTPGQYIALPKATAGSNGIPYDIPSMSGFLVKAADTLVVSPAIPSPGSIQINYSSVIVKNANALRVKKSESISSTDLISTKIDLIGLHYSDRMWIFTEPSCTKNFDNGWDGRKILGSSLAPQIYAVEPDGDYQVNSVADMHNTDIAFQPGDEVEYTMKFTNENIKQKYAGVYLQDLVENKTVDVTESGTTYKFATAPASEPSKRFKIITRYYEKDAPDTESSIKIFSARGTVFIQNLSTNSGECTLYDVLGRTVAKKIYGPNSVTEIGNLTQGAYVTTAITNGEKVSKRIIVQ